MEVRLNLIECLVYFITYSFIVISLCRYYYIKKLSSLIVCPSCEKSFPSFMLHTAGEIETSRLLEKSLELFEDREGRIVGEWRKGLIPDGKSGDYVLIFSGVFLYMVHWRGGWKRYDGTLNHLEGVDNVWFAPINIPGLSKSEEEGD